jgi:2-succinyl-5-enolpyruvyl-6-hydroxy-3-cyclohexene-1-carboxylate synthase
VLADPLSGCRLPGAIAAADALLRVEAIAGWRPDAVLRLGRPWASKVVGSWLAGLSDVPQTLVSPPGVWPDPDRAAASVIQADPGAWCRAVLDDSSLGSEGKGTWAAAWEAAESAAQAAIDDVLAGHAEATESGVARALTAALPDGATLVVSSSMPVRDVEWYSAPRLGLRVLANRGANGIDGVLSTAVGVALAGQPTVALLGDLAFVYDVGGLLWARDRGIALTVVVVDNDGGGIFSFLPQAAAVAPEVFERLWGTPHGLDLTAVFAAYGVPAVRIDQADEVEPAISEAVATGDVRAVVVRTDRAANVAVHDELHAAVAKAVSSLTYTSENI